MEGLETLVLFVVITVIVTLWMMFTDSTRTQTPKYSYHPEEVYGK